MTSNRVDQVSFNGALKNHQRRISILEATPQVAGAPGLPPWFSTTSGVLITPSAGGGDTDPTVSDSFDYVMIQTEDGTPFNDGGTQLAKGTLLAEYLFEVTDPGAVKVDGNSPGAYRVTLQADGIFPVDPTELYQIGTVLLVQGSTQFTGSLRSDGFMTVAGYPDLYAPSGYGNIVRVANPYLDPATSGWPWEWAGGETIALSFMFPMNSD